MRRTIAAALLAAALAGPAAAQGLPDTAPEGQRLIFATRDWSSAGTGLAWSLDREGKATVPGFAPVSNGRLRLLAVTDPKDGHPMLELHEVAAERDRMVGRYPAEGIDPILIYFLETTTRNMAALAGGNPDYIRNRIKAALRDGGTVETADGGGQRVVLEPFAADPAAERMGGFQSMRLTFTVGVDAGAPIAAMTAEAPEAGYALRLAQVTP